MATLGGMFSEQRTGKVSMLRVVFFLWAGGGFAVWAYASLKSASVQTFPESIAAIIATLAASKAAQRFAER